MQRPQKQMLPKKDAKAEQKTVKYIRQERYSGNVSRSFYVGENLEERISTCQI